MTGPSEERVTQAVRDAAWPFRPSCYKDDRLTREKWNDGVYDDAAPCIRAFARFEAETRHAATAPLLDLIEAVDLALPDEIDLFRMIRAAGRSDLAKARAVHEHMAALSAALTAALAQHRTNGDG